MKKINPDIIRLMDMIQAIADAEECAALASKKELHAACYNIAIIGEAAGKLTPALCERHNDIPWTKITGIRHKIIHDYGKVDATILKQVIIDELPGLKQRLQIILTALSKGA